MAVGQTLVQGAGLRKFRLPGVAAFCTINPVMTEGAAVIAFLRTTAAGLALLAAALQPALAQKNTGPVLPTFPPGMAPRPAAPPAYSPPPAYAPPPPVPSAPSAPRAGNPDAERLAQSLPLDPQTRELRDQLPPDPRGTSRRLGLREPRGPAVDLRGRTPSPREIVDALAPR